jgi:hypothetical protein
MTLGDAASIGLPIVAAATIGVLAVARSRRRSRDAAPLAAAAPWEPDPAPLSPSSTEIRAGALDAVSQAVLVVGPDGVVLDANRASQAMFDLSADQHFAGDLRTLECGHVDAHRAAETDGAWNGESWVRHPNGGVRLCLTRVVPLRDAAGTTVAFAESYRDAVAEGLLADDLRDRLYGLRQGIEDAPSAPESDAVREELVRLGAAFRDLELAVRQYERLLPVLAAQDPLTEAIAGLAHDTLRTVTRLRVDQVLHEVPGTLARLHAATEELAHRAGQVAPADRA